MLFGRINSTAIRDFIFKQDMSFNTTEEKVLDNLALFVNRAPRLKSSLNSLIGGFASSINFIKAFKSTSRRGIFSIASASQIIADSNTACAASGQTSKRYLVPYSWPRVEFDNSVVHFSIKNRCGLRFQVYWLRRCLISSCTSLISIGPENRKALPTSRY